MSASRGKTERKIGTLVLGGIELASFLSTHDVRHLLVLVLLLVFFFVPVIGYWQLRTSEKS
ncbi:hypothetical protein [Ktedonobacter robiniae]|uniref:Phage shock protein PspC N-terminal domain-containing protein n=1 Tax=Ktedonobacter robiniae TaxID=2778365 RepID=A0ABQ3V1W0_9CHLR|nr:hypothetical protein [Ktedonobacter robiniae]GHO58948.1 hypothetical protein KSB_74230 [Ktedonobacter robiniae]